MASFGALSGEQPGVFLASTAWSRLHISTFPICLIVFAEQVLAVTEPAAQPVMLVSLGRRLLHLPATGTLLLES